MSLQEFPDFDKAVNARLESVVSELAREFEGIHDREQISRLVGESARQLGGGEVSAFVPVLAQRFARERLQALAQTEGTLEKALTEVLFVSLTGGGRAQIGAALLSRSGGESVRVHSAGTGVASSIDANVVTAMEEIGLDISDGFSRPLTLEVLGAADVIVTMGRSVGSFVIPPSKQHVDWRVGDPAGASLDEVRRVRRDIEYRVEALAADLLRRQGETGRKPAPVS